MNEVVIVADPQFEVLATEICKHLESSLAASTYAKVKCEVTTFSDGECSPQYQESLRGKNVYLLAATTHNSLIRTLLMIDAAKRNAAKKIILLTPYLGYARQDRKDGIRGPLGAKMVADMLTVAGIDEIMCIDLHAAQIEGFFNIPVDHIHGHTIFTTLLKSIVTVKEEDKGKWTICTPDKGGFLRASEYAERLSLPIVAIDKRRDKPNSIASMELVGDVTGKKIIIIDDMVDTAGTLCKAADYLIEKGAESVDAVCTHPVLSGKAFKNLSETKLNTLYVSNSNISDELAAKIAITPKIQVVSISKVLAKAIVASETKVSINSTVNA